MSEWKPKRFWKKVDVVSLEKGFCIKLDAKILKTPAKKEMLLPTIALAKKIAAEWDRQVDEIDPNAMPFTKSANAALDKVVQQFDEVSSLVGDYGDTDLLYYRADSPAELKMRQQSSWDPMIDWAEKNFEVKINCGTGILYIPQDRELVYKLSKEISELSSFQLTALYDIVSITGSLILGLATINGRLSAEDAFNLSRIDELWQIEQWGVDEEAQAVSDLKYNAVLHAQEFFILSSGNKSTIF
jgi:chaperone required for assembly of F1-ATPase